MPARMPLEANRKALNRVKTELDAHKHPYTVKKRLESTLMSLFVEFRVGVGDC